MEDQVQNKQWVCPKCGGQNCEFGKMAATGGGWSRFFDVQNKKFTTITCAQCKYTEFYKADTATVTKVFDFLISNN